MSERNELTQSSGAGTALASRDGARAGATRRVTVTPPVDVFEDRQGVTLLADLPGVTPDKLEIRLEDGHLYIDAEAVVPMPAELRVHHAEIRGPHFARAFALGGDFDTARIDAQLRDGVLRLTIPRREEAKPRRIDVRTD